MACIYTYKGKQYSEKEIKDIVFKEKVKPEDIKFATLDDIANILAYSNSKIILDGWKIEYSTPLGNKYDTLEEVNNEVKEITALFKDLKLEDIDFKVEVDNNKRVAIIIKPNGERIESDKLYEFIQKDKEYAQSRKIIEEYKKINNIQYDPEEVYSRGQEFYHIHNAYSRNNVDTELWVQNLLETIQDKAKIGAKVEMSFATAPKGEVGKGLQHHNKKTKQTVYITAYPKSEDIEFASQIDNHTSSFTDLTVDMIKAFTNQKNERVGITLTKSVPLRNLHTIQPNLATAVDDVAHHNEIVIGLTPYNFRINYEEEVPYHLKKLIDNINKILDDKYGKLEKPEVKIPESKKITKFKVKGEPNIFNTREEAQALANKLSQIDYMSTYVVIPIQVDETIGKQPTKTKENTTSIESVKNKIIKYNEGSLTSKEEFTEVSEKEYIEAMSKGKKGFALGTTSFGYSETYEYNGYIYTQIDFEEFGKIKADSKEYTSQALTNLKVAALKEVARKYPRSLIRSEVKRINTSSSQELYNQFGADELPFQKIPSNQSVKPGVEELFNENPELANSVYLKILANSGISGENLLSLLLKDNIIEKQCS